MNNIDDLFNFYEFVRRPKVIVPKERYIKYGSITLDLDLYNIIIGGNEIRLTKQQYSLLYVLFKAKGAVVSHEKLREALYGGNDPVTSSRVLEAQLDNIKRKIGMKIFSGGKRAGYKAVLIPAEEKVKTEVLVDYLF